MIPSILVVDDEPINLKLVAATLEDNYELHFARSGKDALAYLSDKEVDIILLDIMMPQMNGFEVAQELHKNEKTSHIPIIYLTGDNSEEMIEKAFDSGAADYISKPFRKKELLVRIKNRIETETLKKNLLKQHQEFKTIFDISRDGIAILDLQSNFLDFNNAYLTMTGFSRDELLSTSHIELSIAQDHERAQEALQIVQETGYLESFEKTCIAKSGKHLVVQMALALMPDKKRILVSTTDITEIKDHEKELEKAAHFDPLTKLPNRALFSDRMAQSMANAHRNNQKLAITYIDLDGFKRVNDTYGHDAGDRLLIEVSKQMQNILREGDTLARLGGDEFCVILGNQNDESETFTVLNRLLSTASSPIDIGTTITTVSASIGVTFYADDYNVDADTLLRQADQAMYQAKLRGKNQIAVFDTN